MGIAAYNRSTAALRRQLDAERPSSEELIIRDLNAHPKGSTRLFQATVIRPDAQGRWWLMNRPDADWAEYGRPYRSLWEIAGLYAIRFVGFGHDEHSALVIVEPDPPIERQRH